MDPKTDTGTVDRREFLTRSVKAGLSMAAACAVGFAFYDPIARIPQDAMGSDARSFDFSVKAPGPALVIARGDDRRSTLRRALGAMGGIERFVRNGDRVLLKVNAAFASPPAIAATTHPDLVSEMAGLCLAAGAASVIVTDNPINDPASCFELTGIRRAARSAGAAIVLPETRLFRPLTLPGGELIKNWPVLIDPLRNADKVIGMAPVKDHHRSGASLSMKNWYGLLGGRRNIFHQDIHNIIMELARMVRPTLVILDGTLSMIANGPTGGSLSDLRRTETMIVSTDQVAADVVGASLLGKEASDLPFIARAASAGAGTADVASLKPIRI